LSSKYCTGSTLETIERVNRLISAWPTDDTLPAEGYDGVKSVFKKLYPGLRDIQTAAEEEAKYGNNFRQLITHIQFFPTESLMLLSNTYKSL
jgi:hypothetical protein